VHKRSKRFKRSKLSDQDLRDRLIKLSEQDKANFGGFKKLGDLATRGKRCKLAEFSKCYSNNLLKMDINRYVGECAAKLYADRPNSPFVNVYFETGEFNTTKTLLNAGVPADYCFAITNNEKEFERIIKMGKNYPDLNVGHGSAAGVLDYMWRNKIPLDLLWYDSCSDPYGTYKKNYCMPAEDWRAAVKLLCCSKGAAIFAITAAFPRYPPGRNETIEQMFTVYNLKHTLTSGRPPGPREIIELVVSDAAKQCGRRCVVEDSREYQSSDTSGGYKMLFIQFRLPLN
jgi:hypothetical protein